ncbi:PREDICTED: uncharacterized protein LOC104598390 [Nelumbo nucifera]|uniref:Uncharacterized protein LOC104598390 n=1 Tax=Nelumbo nucifera TaxID=4432 RepID=A0A1U8AAN8_NELNU|nr:PREDICTED: uncharacterized protein LOC104598390 [Nelumbo nucifera]
MKILSWNVRGIGSARKRMTIKEVIKRYDPDIVLLQESKRMEFNNRWARSIWKVRGISWVVAPSWGASGGILTMWKKDVVDGQEELIGKYSILAKFKQQEDDFVWVLTNVYGPIDYREQNELWEELTDIRGLWDEPWFVDAFELKEIPLAQKTFTWSNLQSRPTCSKLDRFLLTLDWEEHWGNLDSKALPRLTSDHWSIMICKEERRNGGPAPLRFENMLLLHPRFTKRVREWWYECNPMVEWEGMRFHRKLQFLKAKIKEWNQLEFGRLEERKRTLMDKIESLDLKEERGDFGEANKEQRRGLRSQLEDYLHEKELAEGAFVGHFKSILRRPVSRGVWLEGLNWPDIGDDNRRILERMFDLKEIKVAIFSMNRTKAPGPDGFTMAFYQDYWDTVKDELLLVFEEFHRRGVVNPSVNSTFLALIPKKKDALHPKDFRPISLVNSLYKTLAKVLSLRLKEVLPTIISPNQGTFVSARQIINQILIANESVEHFRKEGKKGVVCKLDMEKANDLVEWEFLRKVNFEKSCVVGVNMEEGEVRETAKVLGCEVSKWPLNYLGLPLGDNPKRESFWNLVVESFEKKLVSWKRNYLSMGGRITLIKATLANLPIYFLSVFKILVKVANRLEKMMRHFLWETGEEKRDHRVAWEVVTRSKNSGGLGLGNIRNRNLALLGKWYDLNSGNAIKFWEQTWVGDGPLKDQFPSLWHMKRGRIMWRGLRAAVCWSLWEERNARIFSKVEKSTEELRALILIRVVQWMKSLELFTDYTMDDMLRN